VIKWKVEDSRHSAKVGILSLAVRRTWWRKCWYATVGIRGSDLGRRYGNDRMTAERAKEDAVRIAKELLLDMQTCIAADMSKLGVDNKGE